MSLYGPLHTTAAIVGFRGQRHDTHTSEIRGPGHLPVHRRPFEPQRCFRSTYRISGIVVGSLVVLSTTEP
jgi:hypothetical protein